MIGNITNRLFSDKEKHPLIWAVLTIIILLVIILLLCRSCSDNKPQENARETLPEIVINGNDDGYEEDNNGGIQVDTTNGLIMNAGTKSQDLALGNPNDNNCVMIIPIYLADKSRLYKSDYIYPNEYIGQVNIDKVLKQGTYKNPLLV